MSLHNSQTPKPNVSETIQPSLAQENNQLVESAYITSDYQKTSTNRDFGNETETKFDSSSPDRPFNYSVDDKQPYSAYSTAGLTSNLGSAALNNYQYSSRDYTLPSTYGISNYQSAPKTEGSGPVTQSYSYSSYKHETTSPTIKALNENTATLLGRSAALDSNNFGKTSLTLQGLAPENRTLSFGASNYSADLKNLGLGKEEYKTSFTTATKEANPDLKYSNYLKSNPTTFEYGKSPYETTFGSTANPIPTAGGIEGTSSSLYKNYSVREEEVRKSGVQANKGLYSSTDYTDLINKISNKNTETPQNDNYTIIKPDSLNNTEKKQRQTVGSHYYQSTYPNTVRTPSESGKKDRYANYEISGVMSPPFKRDKVEVDRHAEVVDDYVISEPHITKKTLYTIENANANSISINGGKDLVNQLSVHRTPDRKIKSKSGSPSPFDDLKHALKNESIQISKIVIETVENYGGEVETYQPAAAVTTHNRHGSEKFDIVMEQQQTGSHLLHNRNSSRTESIKSPGNIRIQRNLIEESSSFKEQPHHLHSRKHSDASSSKVGGTINAINERIKDLDHYLSSGTRSASKQSNLVSPNTKAESSGIHHRVHHHHEEKAAATAQDLKEKEKQDEKERAKLKEKEKQDEKEKARLEKERVKAEKEKEKEREKREKEEAKLKAKQAAALAKEANKNNNSGSSGHLIVKAIIGFIILLLLGVLSLELIMGAEEYDALLDTPLNQVLP